MAVGAGCWQKQKVPTQYVPDPELDWSRLDPLPLPPTRETQATHKANRTRRSHTDSKHCVSFQVPNMHDIEEEGVRRFWYVGTVGSSAAGEQLAARAGARARAR